jgi:FkbH-like protein
MYQLTWRDPSVWRHVDVAGPIPPPPDEPAVASIARVVWEEHCVECAVPACYTSCSLYHPRKDQKCARFVYGIVPNGAAPGPYGYSADIEFRRWAKLEAIVPSPPVMQVPASARREAAIVNALETALSSCANLLQPINKTRRLDGLFTVMRGKWARRPSGGASAADPDALLVAVYNPASARVRIGIEVIQDRPLFRRALELEPGWNRCIVSYADLHVSRGRPFRILIAPQRDENTRLVFAWLDFVRWKDAVAKSRPARSSPKPAEHVKCVVWDLDNTLWAGTIGDDGPEGVTPYPWALDLIRRLDERGILQSVVSKNEHALAWEKIEQLGLADYLLFPAINWGPKSGNLREVAQNLNIGLDTLALVDDSAFERAEVSAALPEIRVYDPAVAASLLDLPEFDVPITEFAAKRRLTYLDESRRRTAASSWGEDYVGFLRSCGMRVRIGRPGRTERPRCLELLQRTNQFNLSGRKYGDAEFEALLDDRRFDCLFFDVTDRFGEYGIVGFAAFDTAGGSPVLCEFVMSCRVAQKLVDETFFKWYMAKSRRRGATALEARLVVTPKNKPIRDLLASLHFVPVSETGADVLLRREIESAVELPEVAEIADETEEALVRNWGDGC